MVIHIFQRTVLNTYIHRFDKPDVFKVMMIAVSSYITTVVVIDMSSLVCECVPDRWTLA